MTCQFLPETNSSPLKIKKLEDEMSFWDKPILGYVSFREGT